MKRIFIILWVLLVSVPGVRGQSVRYDVFLDSPETHFFRVEMTIQNAPAEDTLKVAIPAWCCLYQIRDFAQYVQMVQAKDRQNRALPIQKSDKQTWMISTEKSSILKVSYRVFGNDLSPFGTQLNSKHAFINPALILFYVVQGRDWPVTVVYHKPKDWRILTAAQKVKTKENAFRANSYDELVDNPVEIGRFEKLSFQSDGATYDVGFYDYHNEFSLNKFKEMLKRIVHAETISLMHDVPFKRYVFIFQIVDSYGSGMEHANSCVISFNRQRAAADVFDLTSLIAHEFFHVWNVKRIKPKNLFRYDWTKENYTRALWFAEGGTCYYAALVRKRAGFWNRQQLLDHFAERITQEENDPGRKIESPEMASFNAWFEKYPWYVRPENSISYYRSGEILSLLLDLKMRVDTKNRFSLDDVLRVMNGFFAKRHIPYNDSQDILAVINSLTGKDYSDFFKKYVSGTERPPYETIFRAAGLDFKKETETVPDLGFTAERNFDQPFVVTTVETGSPAQKAGLDVNDRVLEVNGKPTGLYIEDSFKGLKAGDRVVLRIKRGNKEQNIAYKIGMKSKKQYVITAGKRLSAFQDELLNQWFAGKP
ncbi:MAG: M61 family metallopeptidase [Calditrichaeota bacterium]|nr:M61 family metallopeptidase [Calditrichota bacterium]